MAWKAAQLTTVIVSDGRMMGTEQGVVDTMTEAWCVVFFPLAKIKTKQI